MTCHHIPSVRCPECADDRPSMGYWPTPTSYCTGCAALREENARLVMAEAEAMALVLNHEGAIARLTRERDEARAETERMTKVWNEEMENTARWKLEVSRLEGLILAAKDSEDPWGLESDALWAEVDRIRAQRGEEKEKAEAVVARLEGLADGIEAEAREVAPGKTFYGGPLHGASVFNVMMWAVRRIRAQREVSPTTVIFLNRDGSEAGRIENLAPAQREEGRCLCDDDSPNHCAKCTRELLAQREEGE